jgi:hypothetical protein
MEHDLDAVVAALAAIPRAIGAIVCDYEGEAVVHALGRESLSPAVERGARSLMPREFETAMSVEEFMLKLIGAEPCALFRSFEDPSRGHGVGGMIALELRYQDLDLLVRRLPDEYYVCLLLRPPALIATAQRRLAEATRALARMIS